MQEKRFSLSLFELRPPEAGKGKVERERERRRERAASVVQKWGTSLWILSSLRRRIEI